MKTGLLLLALATLLIAPAYAGFKWPIGVRVDPINRSASGDAFTARSAPNPYSYISCSVSGYAFRGPDVMCDARDNNGNSVYCFSFVPEMVQAATASGPNSYYYFRWDADGHCTQISVSNSSSWGPIQP